MHTGVSFQGIVKLVFLMNTLEEQEKGQVLGRSTEQESWFKRLGHGANPGALLVVHVSVGACVSGCPSR